MLRLLACALAMLVAAPLPAATPETVLLRPAAVWTAGEPLHAGWVVLTRGNRIVAAGPAATVAVPADAQIIELPGATLIPGLMDVHSHLFLHELAEEARGTYGPGNEQVHDGAHLRFVNELYHRLTRVIEQLLAEEATRPADDVVLRMLLAPRADKVAERLVFNAYARAIQGFESYDTTVLMGS